MQGLSGGAVLSVVSLLADGLSVTAIQKDISNGTRK